MILQLALCGTSQARHLCMHVHLWGFFILRMYVHVQLHECYAANKKKMACAQLRPTTTWPNVLGNTDTVLCMCTTYVWFHSHFLNQALRPHWHFENGPDFKMVFNIMFMCTYIYVHTIICTCRRLRGWDSPYHCSAEVGLKSYQISICTTFELLGGGCSSSLSAGFPLWWTKHA